MKKVKKRKGEQEHYALNPRILLKRVKQVQLASITWVDAVTLPIRNNFI